MAEYIYDNILINPSKEGIESLIGKEVYFHNNPYLCLDYANKKSTDHLGVLAKIRKNSAVPFTIEQGNTVHEHTCIIVKKEEPKPEFIPFESADEFLGHYGSSLMQPKQTLDFLYRFLDGMWIRNRCSKTLCQVVSIGAGGVYLGGINYEVDWNVLYRNFEFLDGTPCGRKVKNV